MIAGSEFRSRALWEYSHEISRSIEILSVALRDENSSVRSQALDTLVHIGADVDDPDAFAAVAPALDDVDPSVRIGLIKSLSATSRGLWHKGSPRSVELLIRAFTNQDEAIRQEATEAFGSMLYSAHKLPARLVDLARRTLMDDQGR